MTRQSQPVPRNSVCGMASGRARHGWRTSGKRWSCEGSDGCPIVYVPGGVVTGDLGPLAHEYGTQDTFTAPAEQHLKSAWDPRPHDGGSGSGTECGGEGNAWASPTYKHGPAATAVPLPTRWSDAAKVAAPHDEALPSTCLARSSLSCPPEPTTRQVPPALAALLPGLLASCV
eukprot:gnl/TRDRNA2_/TRDRNA2_199511_c0_seq1.p1 gnl/TRDRNA2_/TRDRNA2_199511_c0~~gnl/TRDRNA2_/TRDRNA2_199511_c0_seq1.p1  ORF type:complete len:173 (+),score=13.56 gnl/TRDRNA2_/TRDRNA2_199511_c0_seq1:154-672(+)